MKRTLEYKGFVGQYYYNIDEEILHGKLIDIPDLVIFEGKPEFIKLSFMDAVDDYIELCKEAGK